MKTLYIIRHAKSSWEFDLDDKVRPLNNRGINDANLIADKLKTLGFTVDKALCSDAKRAQMTADIIVPRLDIKERLLVLEPKLYDFDGHQVIEVIKECSDAIDSLLLFGHNHAFTSIANLYGDKLIDNLPTAGVVAIAFDVENWKNINVGKTLFTLYPKDLR